MRKIFIGGWGYFQYRGKIGIADKPTYAFGVDIHDRSGVVYSTLRTYARSPGLETVDFTSIQKLARTFDVMIEDLVEVVQE